MESLLGDGVGEIGSDVMELFQLDGVLILVTSRRFRASEAVSCKDDKFNKFLQPAVYLVVL